MASMCSTRVQLLSSFCRRSFKSAIRQGVRSLVSMASNLDKIPDVDIDPDGTFKYILVKVHDDDNDGSKLIVRGYAKCHWHADIYDEISSELKPHGSGLDTECLGGGRIKHDAAGKKIDVYGYSQGFGKADHQISVDILKKKYSDYVVTWSDEGY